MKKDEKVEKTPAFAPEQQESPIFTPEPIEPAEEETLPPAENVETVEGLPQHTIDFPETEAAEDLPALETLTQLPASEFQPEPEAPEQIPAFSPVPQQPGFHVSPPAEPLPPSFFEENPEMQIESYTEERVELPVLEIPGGAAPYCKRLNNEQLAEILDANIIMDKNGISHSKGEKTHYAAEIEAAIRAGSLDAFRELAKIKPESFGYDAHARE